MNLTPKEKLFRKVLQALYEEQHPEPPDEKVWRAYSEEIAARKKILAEAEKKRMLVVTKQANIDRLLSEKAKAEKILKAVNAELAKYCGK